MRKRFSVAAMVVIAMMLVVPAVMAANTTVTVTSNDVGVTWSTANTRPGGENSFVVGPQVPPIGNGSLEMTSASGSAKAQLFNYDHIGTSLSDIDALGYWDYRSSASTNPVVQRISINLEVDYIGDGDSFTTLVYEPAYASGGAGDLQTDVWQHWDAHANGEAVWWSTRTIPGVACNPNDPVGCSGEPLYFSWNYFVNALPNAEVKGGFGFNIGSGWNGAFSGAADALMIGIDGESTTYDFEPLLPPPTSMDDCKKGGWATFDNPSFKNQGDCVSYVRSNSNSKK